MDSTHAKAMMDAFYEAKRIRDQLPPLPDGIKPSYINMLDAIVQLESAERMVRVSDIADFRSIPRPGVTRTVREMEQAGLVEKMPDKEDHRVIHLHLTDYGRELHRRYVTEYFGKVTAEIDDVTDEEAESMIRTIRKVGRHFGISGGVAG